MIQVNKFMIVQLIMYQDRKYQVQQGTPSPNQNKKTINLEIIGLKSQKQMGDSIFRKPRKVIKTLKIDTQPKLENRTLIHQEFRNWLNRLHASKDTRKSKQKIQSQQALSERNKQTISTVYDLMIKDQKLAQCLPMTNKHYIDVKRDTLKLNLEEVFNLRSKSSKKKVAIEQICFQSQIESKSSHCLGFRPIASRCPQRLKWSKKNVLSNTPTVSSISFFKKSNIRTYSLQNNRQRNQTIQTLTHQKSSKNIFDSPRRIGTYINRSRQKKCWQTIGLKEWVNKPTGRNLYQSRS